jgi:hypothetical protein
MLHRDEEVRPFDTVLVDRRDVVAAAPELLLQGGAAALHLEDLLALLVVVDEEQLQRHLTPGSRIGGEEDGRHAARANLVLNLVRTDVRNSRHVPLSGRAPAVASRCEAPAVQ